MTGPHIPSKFDALWAALRAMTPGGAILRELASGVHLSLDGMDLLLTPKHLPALRAAVALLEGRRR